MRRAPCARRIVRMRGAQPELMKDPMLDHELRRVDGARNYTVLEKIRASGFLSGR